MNDKKQVYQFGNFQLNVEEKQLHRLNGEIVALPPKTFELLAFLVENNNRLLTKTELMDKVWADSFVEEGNLKINIHSLRKILDVNGESFIETVPKHGYRLTGEVKLIETENLNLAQSENLPKAPEDKFSNEVQKRFKSQKQWLIIVTVLICGLIIFAIYSFWKPATSVDQIKTLQSTSLVKTIAVLPFRNLTKDKQDEFLCIGLTDALITKLASINRLSVRPTSSILPLGDSPTPQLVSEKLQVENVLEGTIQRIKNRLRISVQLVQMPHNKVLWANSFEVNDTDLLKVQESISIEITNLLLTNLSQDERSLMARNETDNDEAFALYLKGQYFLNKRSIEDLKKSLEFFQQAKEKDANYSLAYVGIARVYLIMGDSGWGIISPRESIEKARPELEKSLQLNPNSAETVSMLGTIQLNFDWNIEKAKQTLQQAVRINPNLATPHHQLAWLLIAEENYSEAEKEVQKALRLEPTSSILQTEIGYPAFFAKNYVDAEKFFRAGLDFDQNSIPARLNLWRVLHQQAKFEEAMIEINKLEATVGKDFPLLLICKARTLFQTGKIDEAEQIYLALKDNEKISPLFMAILSAELGKTDETFALLDKSFVERNDYLLNLNHAPEFEKLKNDPRFAELVKKILVSSF